LIDASEIEALDCLTSMMRYFKIPSQELAARLVLRLIEVGETTAAELAEELGASYPLVLRVINELERIGVIETGKMKSKGRGRPRKLVKLNKEKLAEALSVCEERARVLRERLLGPKQS
jgi:predicted ArsR family transcriptional regulator